MSMTLEERQCLKKKPYINRRIAAEKAKLASKRANEFIKPYRCGHCFQWHIGHVPTAMLPHKPKLERIKRRTKKP